MPWQFLHLVMLAASLFAACAIPPCPQHPQHPPWQSYLDREESPVPRRGLRPSSFPRGTVISSKTGFFAIPSREWGFSVWAHNATYTNNSPEDVAAVTRRAGLRLEQRGDKWVTVTTNSRGQEVVRSATGRYDFVTINGEIRVLRPGDPISTHTALAGNGPVDYAGQIVFSGRSNRGLIRSWDNGSGHFTPAAADAGQAGLPMQLFRPVPGS